MRAGNAPAQARGGVGGGDGLKLIVYVEGQAPGQPWVICGCEWLSLGCEWLGFACEIRGLGVPQLVSALRKIL